MGVLDTVGGWLGITPEKQSTQATIQDIGTMVSASKGQFVNENAGANRQQLQDFYTRLQGQNAAQARAAQMGQAAQAGVGQVGTANQMNATLGSAADAGRAAQARAAGIDQSNVNEVRGQQQALNQNLAGIAMGTQSGMGQLQLQQAQASNLAAANALAQSGRTGQNANLSARNLANSVANLNTNAAAQSAMTAMQEQQAARSALGQNLGQVAGQDIGLATNQAGLQQQAAMQNAAARQNMAQYNAGNQQQMALANMSAQNQAGAANQSALNQFLLAQAQLNQQGNQFNAGLQQQTNMANVANQQQVALANLQAQQAQRQLAAQGGLAALGGLQNIDQQNVANQIAGVQAMMGSQNAANQFNVAQAQQTSQGVGDVLGAVGQAAGLIAMSDKRKKKKVKSAEQQMSELLDALYSKRVSDMNLKENITTNFNANGFNQVPIVGPGGGSNGGFTQFGTSMGQIISGSRKGPEADITPTAAPAGYAMPSPVMSAPAGISQAGGYALPAMKAAVSDKEQKYDKHSVDHALMGMLDKLKAYQYEYKHPDMPGAGRGPQLGVMAQDLEKSDAGKMFVKESPDGVKMVEFGKMLPALLAGMATIHKRVKHLEGHA